MTTLDEVRLRAFVDVMWKEEVKERFRIIVEGDLQADYFYVVESGRFEIFEGEEGGNSAELAMSHAESKVLNVVSQGGSFGELALLYFVPRAATVQAITDGVVWDILMKVSDNKLKEYVRYLNDVSILDTLLETEKKALAKALVEMHFTQGEMVVQQDEPGNTFYIMYEGNVDIIKDNNVVANLEAMALRMGNLESFAGMCLLWPSVAFVTLTFLFTCLTPVYQNFCEKSASFRIFLQRFVGMPDKRKVTSPKPQIFIQLLRVIAALAQQWLCLSYFRIITALGGFRNLQQLLRSRAREDTVLGRCILTVLRLTAMIVCMAGTMIPSSLCRWAICRSFR
eukprot:g16553.t1